jgi:hypothetical protein
MKTRLSLLAAIIVAILGCQLSPPPFTEFVSEEGGFSVSMPGPPNEKSETTSEGVLSYTYYVETSDATYIVVYSDFRRDFVENNDPESILDTVQDGAVGNKELLSSEPITLDGHPGRDLKIQTSDGTVAFTHFYLVDVRLYQLIASTESGTMTAEIGEFFDSFTLK